MCAGSSVDVCFPRDSSTRRYASGVTLRFFKWAGETREPRTKCTHNACYNFARIIVAENTLRDWVKRRWILSAADALRCTRGIVSRLLSIFIYIYIYIFVLLYILDSSNSVVHLMTQRLFTETARVTNLPWRHGWLLFFIFRVYTPRCHLFPLFRQHRVWNSVNKTKRTSTKQLPIFGQAEKTNK